MNQPPSIQLTLSLNDVQLILEILGAQAWNRVSVLIPLIQGQTQTQLQSPVSPATKETKD